MTGYLAADGGACASSAVTSSPARRPTAWRAWGWRAPSSRSASFRASARSRTCSSFLQQHQEEQLLARLLRTPRVRRLEAAAIERARRLLDLVGLGAKADARGRAACPTGSASCWPSPAR